jgi:hypothetical protein
VDRSKRHLNFKAVCIFLFPFYYLLSFEEKQGATSPSFKVNSSLGVFSASYLTSHPSLCYVAASNQATELGILK